MVGYANLTNSAGNELSFKLGHPVGPVEIHSIVVVVDISMPILNGIDAVRRLRESGSSAQVVFLTVHESSEYVAAARATGALGYVVKPRLATDLSVAIKEVHAGRSYHSPSIAPVD